MAFNNPQILNVWCNASSKKKEVLRSCNIKSNLSEHIKYLPPLNCGDQVMIKIQNVNFLSSGRKVELKDYH